MNTLLDRLNALRHELLRLLPWAAAIDIGFGQTHLTITASWTRNGKYRQAEHQCLWSTLDHAGDPTAILLRFVTELSQAFARTQ